MTSLIRNRVAGGLVLAAAFGMCGCDPPGSGAGGSSTAVEAPATAGANGGTGEDVAAGAAEVTLADVDLAGYQAAIGKQQGKVVLVDFWGTWCGPCRASFPKVAALGEKYEKDGLAVVTVSMEFDPANGRGEALEFLKSQSAKSVNLYNTVDFEQAMTALDIGDALPHYKIYDRAGKLVKAYRYAEESPIDFEDLEATLRQSLAKNP